jgi:hypothetical protein
MRKLAFVFALAFSTFLHGVSSFPRLSLYTLKGEMRLLPSGQKELVFVGCRGEARQALTCWYKLFCDYQGKIGRLGVMVVPVFPSFMANRFLRHPLMALIRHRIPEHLSHHVAVLFSNAEETASLFQLSCGELEQLQIFLVDEKGKILWKASGEPTSQSVRQLKQCVSIGS